MVTTNVAALARVGTPDVVLVVSDLHLGVGQDPDTGRYHRRENFLADLAFAAFLEHHAPQRAGEALLVVNGDAFDFLRISEVPRTDAEFAAWRDALAELGAPRPEAELRRLAWKERVYGLRTTDYKSVWKLVRIAQGHPTFFAALGGWVERGGWIVFVKGNHDLELFWPLVQAAIQREIARAHPRAPVADRVLFTQDSIRFANVYIEHGHRFESVTAVKGPPTLPGRPTELTLPLGSFVNRYVINRLEGMEPFLDNIKPVQRLLTTIVRRHPLQALKIAWHSLAFLMRAARPYWLKDGFGFLLYFGSIFLQLGVVVGVAVLIVSSGAREAVAAALPRARYLIGVAGLLGPYLLGVLRDLVPKRRPAVGEDRYGAGIHGALAGLGFSAGYPRIYGVLGHTHVPDAQDLPAIAGAPVLYLNSGTWIALWDEDRPDLLGRTVRSFIRFTRDQAGWYRHEQLEWQGPAGATTATPSIILDRGLAPRRP